MASDSDRLGRWARWVVLVLLAVGTLGGCRSERRARYGEERGDPAMNASRSETRNGSSDDRSADRRALVDQLAAEGITSTAVLDAIGRVPRHRFVPPELAADAYVDHALPIAEDQTISQPFIVAYMTEALGVQAGERVLEVGTGSGYQAAVLAEMGLKVYTIEILPALAKQADDVLRRIGYDSIVRRVGDGYLGWPEHAPYDGILVTAAAPRVPTPLVEQLAPGARLVIPLEEAGSDEQWIWVLEKESDGEVVRRRAIPVRFVPMTGAVQRRRD